MNDGKLMDLVMLKLFYFLMGIGFSVMTIIILALREAISYGATEVIS